MVSFAGLVMGLDRLYINIDYFIPIVLFAFGLNLVAVAFLLIFFFADLLVLVSAVYPFIRLSALLGLLRYAYLVPAYFMLAVTGLTITLGLLVWVFSRIKQSAANKKAALVVLNLVLLLTVLVNTYGAGGPSTWYGASGKILTSQSQYLLSTRLTDTFVDNFSGNLAALEPVGASVLTAHWFDAVEGGKPLPGKMLLVVVESWGYPLEPAINQALLQPLLTAARSKGAVVASGELARQGTTVNAELHELCRLRAEHFNFKDKSEGFEPCLPNRLTEQGYRSISFHAASDNMYDRKYWYPRAGFTDSIFFESRLWPQRCRSFPGACDADMAPLVAEQLQSDEQQFIYWLTLNNHWPFRQQDIRYGRFPCADFQITHGTEVCRSFNLLTDFFYAFAAIIEKTDLTDTEIIFVGDHPPRLTDNNELVEYFNQSSVSWLRLRFE